MSTSRHPSLLSAALLAALATLAMGCTPSSPVAATPPAATPTMPAAPGTTSSIPTAPGITTSGTTPANANVSDADVSTNVKTALQRDATLKGYDIQVITLKGDVRLIGMLDSAAHVRDAVEVARGAEGVHSIHDELTVRP